MKAQKSERTAIDEKEKAKKAEQVANDEKAGAVLQAQIVDVRRLAAESRAVRHEFPQRSTLLAVEAGQVEA